jgi:hypothetical protein
MKFCINILSLMNKINDVNLKFGYQNFEINKKLICGILSQDIFLDFAPEIILL